MGLLLFAALLPSVVLCIYIYKKDKLEKESLRLLVKLILYGMLSCLPAAILELAVIAVINRAFAAQAMTVNVGREVVNTSAFYLHALCENFIGVALIEECVKFAVIFRITRNDKNYNCLFDGLVYAVFVSLGFAAFENVFYVLENGMKIAIIRGVMSVPGHMFFGVIMGNYYRNWHVCYKTAKTERKLKKKGVIDKDSEITNIFNKDLAMCLLMPALVHGLYNFCCIADTWWSISFLIAFVIYLYIYSFKKVKKMSDSDEYESVLVNKNISSKYEITYSSTEINEKTEVKENAGNCNI